MKMETFKVFVHDTRWRGILGAQYEIAAQNAKEARVIAYLIHYQPVTTHIDEGQYKTMLRYAEVI